MQANRKQIGLFIIALGLIIIAVIIYFVFKTNKNVDVVTEPNTNTVNTETPIDEGIGTTTPSDAPRNYQKYDISKEAVHEITADDLGKIAMSFAERFGSYSNQSNYGNFTDLKILMTKDMRAWSDKYVEELKKKPQSSNVYYGVTTQALTYNVESFSEMGGMAIITVTTQRRESTEKINGGEAYKQDLTLTLQNVNGDWLFDKAVWSK